MTLLEEIKKKAGLNESYLPEENILQKAMKNPDNSAYKEFLKRKPRFALINSTTDEVYEIGDDAEDFTIKEFPVNPGDEVVVFDIKNKKVVRKFNTE